MHVQSAYHVPVAYREHECVSELGFHVPSIKSYRDRTSPLGFTVSPGRPEKRGIDLAIPGLVVLRVIPDTTVAPISGMYFHTSMSEYDNSSAGRISGVWLGCWLWVLFFVRFTACKY